MIPRTIHQIWLGGEPPREVEEMMRSVQHHHPNWNYRLWTDGDLPELRNASLFQWAPSLAMKADVLRYELLYDHGGVYLDADFQCHKPVDALFPDQASLRLVSEFGVVCNSAMGAAPGHAFIKCLIDELGTLPEASVHRQPHLITGPYFVDALFIRERLYEREPCVLLPGDYFFPPRTRVPSALQQAERKRYLTHAAMASWRRGGLLQKVRGSKLRTRLRRFADLSAE